MYMYFKGLRTWRCFTDVIIVLKKDWTPATFFISTCPTWHHFGQYTHWPQAFDIDRELRSPGIHTHSRLLHAPDLAIRGKLFLTTLFKIVTTPPTVLPSQPYSLSIALITICHNMLCFCCCSLLCVSHH